MRLGHPYSRIFLPYLPLLLRYPSMFTPYTKGVSCCNQNCVVLNLVYMLYKHLLFVVFVERVWVSRSEVYYILFVITNIIVVTMLSLSLASTLILSLSLLWSSTIALSYIFYIFHNNLWVLINIYMFPLQFSTMSCRTERWHILYR